MPIGLACFLGIFLFYFGMMLERWQHRDTTHMFGSTHKANVISEMIERIGHQMTIEEEVILDEVRVLLGRVKISNSTEIPGELPE